MREYIIRCPFKIICQRAYLILNTIKEPSSLIRENMTFQVNDDGANPSWVLIQVSKAGFLFCKNQGGGEIV